MSDPERASDPALVVVAIDGLTSLKSGIGSVVHWFFEAFEEIRALTPALDGERWSLHALSPRLDPASSDHSPEVCSEVSAICRKHRGSVGWFDVEDNSSLKSVWSLDRPERWRSMCAAAAAAIRRLAEGRPKVTVLAHGTMYATLRSHFRSSGDVQFVYMTHTLGRVFLDANARNRTDYEDEGFADLGAFPQDRIGYVGSYYRDVLLKDYGLREAALAPFVNAVYRRSRRFVELRARPGAGAALGPVPDGKRLVFSWGRCMPQKGFDVVIPAFARFLARQPRPRDWHLVLLMPQEVSSRDYVESLWDALGALPEGAFTVVGDFDDLLPFRILQHGALEIAVFASRFEAGPLTLIEALTFGHERVRIVWNDIPPMRHLLSRQPHTFGFTPLDPEAMARALDRAARSDRRGIEKESVTDFAASMAAGLSSTLDWWYERVD